MADDGDINHHDIRLELHIKKAARCFWVKNRQILQAHGLHREDVEQQAWVEYLTMREKSQEVSPYFLQTRLLDWMRKLTHWDYVSHERRDSLVLMDKPPEAAIEQHPERVEFRRIMEEESGKLGGRMVFILTKYLEGYSMKAIGSMLQRTEGRISQQLKAFVLHMRTVVALIIALLVAPFFFSAQVWAQEPPQVISGCTQLEWKANTEPDLAGYGVYVRKSPSPDYGARVDMPNDAISVPCVDIGIVEGAQYDIQMTAYDTSGNESLPSETITVHWPDVTAPAIPVNGCLTGQQTLSNGSTIEVQTCWKLLP